MSCITLNGKVRMGKIASKVAAPQQKRYPPPAKPIKDLSRDEIRAVLATTDGRGESTKHQILDHLFGLIDQGEHF